METHADIAAFMAHYILTGFILGFFLHYAVFAMLSGPAHAAQEALSKFS